MRVPLAEEIAVFGARLRATAVLAAEGQKLRAALTALVAGQLAVPSAEPARLRGPTRRAAGALSRRVSLNSDDLVDLLGAAEAGLAISDFTAALGAGERTILRRLSELVAAGLIVRTGLRRGTRYALPGRSVREARSKRRGGAAAREPAASAAATSEAAPSAVPPTPAGQVSSIATWNGSAAPSGTADFIDEVRRTLKTCFDGRPVKPERIAYWLKCDPELVDSTLMYLVTRREVKVSGAPGRCGYVPRLVPPMTRVGRRTLPERSSSAPEGGPEQHV